MTNRSSFELETSGTLAFCCYHLAIYFCHGFSYPLGTFS